MFVFSILTVSIECILLGCTMSGFGDAAGTISYCSWSVLGISVTISWYGASGYHLGIDLDALLSKLHLKGQLFKLQNPFLSLCMSIVP